MILKSDSIAQLLKEGLNPAVKDPLCIVPSCVLRDLDKKGAASVDLRLGTWFLNLRQTRITHLPVREQPHEAKLAKQVYVPFGTEYLLHPGGFVLGITLEWLRLPRGIAGYVIGRSSWGRRGVIIATATGVHPGFKGCLTLEISNVGEIPVQLTPGMTICQLFLEEVRDTGSPITDHSQFVGHRKPRLGKVAVDSIADRLFREY